MKRKCLTVGIILLFVGVTIAPGVNATISKPSEIVETSDDEYNFFSFAIIWGEFEFVKKPYLLISLEVYNSDINNQSMNVIGYVRGVGFIYRNASWVYCPWWLGVVRSHRLFVIAWGHSVHVT